MYFVISRLDEEKLAKLDFMVNFGVGLYNIHQMLDMMENGGDFDNVKQTFEMLEFYQLLKIYKYFSWANKKLLQVFFIENKDDISEDLLSDFKDPDNEAKFMKQNLAKTKSI